MMECLRTPSLRSSYFLIELVVAFGIKFLRSKIHVENSLADYPATARATKTFDFGFTLFSLTSHNNKRDKFRSFSESLIEI